LSLVGLELLYIYYWIQTIWNTLQLWNSNQKYGYL